MGTLKGKKNLVIAVPPSFWPQFFAQPLDVQFVGPAICFCLSAVSGKNDKRTDLALLPGTQFVVAYPEEGEGVPFVPDQALFDIFPVETMGKPIRPRDLRDLAPLSEMRRMTGVRLFELERGTRRIFCAVPTWESMERVSLADSFLAFTTETELLLGEGFPVELQKSPDYMFLFGVYHNVNRTEMSGVLMVRNVNVQVMEPEDRGNDVEDDNDEVKPPAVVPKKQLLN